MSRPTHDYAQAALLSLFAATLSACGGGDGASSVPTPDAPPAAAAPAASAPAPAPVALTTISGMVADGPLAGATVCYDLNDNSRCDAGEPTSKPTDVEGHFSFDIDQTLAGQHRVIAMVPASAIDKDTGSAVGTAFTLVAPATGAAGSQTVFVSPLTTLVQAQIDVSGWSLQKAADFVQAQAELEKSPLAEFISGSDTGSRRAASVARLVMLTLNQQAALLSGVIGQTDLSGDAVTTEQLRQVGVRDMLGGLPVLAAAAAGSAISAAATPAARETALAQAAMRLASLPTSLSAESAKLAVGLAKMPPDKSVDPLMPTASLAAFRYQGADNWYYRALLATAADNALDASGRSRYYDQRTERVAGQEKIWGSGSSASRAGDLHWNGNAWADCPFGFRSDQSPLAGGSGEYSYCGKLETGVRSRSVIDIAGRSLRSVIETVRALPGGSSGVNFADWGPADLTLLGTATMPAGSKLSYQSNTTQSTAVTYDPRALNEVGIFGAAAAAGGDARNGGSPACSVPTNQVASPATSLDDLIAQSTGRPCVFSGGVSTGPRDEWWSASTVSVGTLPDARTPPAGTGSFYTTTAKLRVAFVPGSNVANFYSCMERASNGSNRNCDLIGTGNYRIEQLGDGRTLELSGQPELALRLDYRRVFVERGGKVYYGYRTPNGRTSAVVRLNLPATNAVFAQLGVPLLNPVD